MDLLTSYQDPSSQSVLRVTTVTRRWVDSTVSSEELVQGFDQETAAVVMARFASLKMESEETFDATRWLDRFLIRLCSKFGDYRKDDPSSFTLNPSFSLFPQFMFNLLRSQFVQLFLLFFTLFSTAIADDAECMSKLVKWKNVKCTTNRVTSINIASQSLTGTLSPDLNSLSQLTSLSGGGGGTTPSSGSGGAPSGSPNAASGGFALSLAWIGGIVVIAVFFVAVVVFVFCKCQAKNRHGKFGRVNSPENGKGEVKIDMMNIANSNEYVGVPSELHSQGSERSDIHVFEGGNATISIQVLRQVTDNFSEKNILGRGGFGVVYKGELRDGSKIAVKRMESVATGSKRLNEFQAEIAILSKVRHRHLVALFGYCINGNERLLVYEYMPQGMLTQHLFDWHENGCAPLTWKQRITIALDVARGVEYMHSLAQQSFIHRDLKPSNILLSDDMRAKVADFGLVKSVLDGKYSMETKLAGTFGYLAPEYAATGKVTTKVDVYAFGVVLMELITGRRALDDTLDDTVSDERSHLVSWFNNKSITKAIDQTLDPDEETMESIYEVAELASHCTAHNPNQRPDMGHAVNVLVPLVEQWKPTSHDEEEGYDIDIHMSLPQALQRWQANEDTFTTMSDMYLWQSIEESHFKLCRKYSNLNVWPNLPRRRRRLRH